MLPVDDVEAGEGRGKFDAAPPPPPPCPRPPPCSPLPPPLPADLVREVASHARLTRAQYRALCLVSHEWARACRAEARERAEASLPRLMAAMRYAPPPAGAPSRWCARYVTSTDEEEEEELARIHAYRRRLRCAACGSAVEQVGACDACGRARAARAAEAARRAEARAAEAARRAAVPWARVLAGPLLTAAGIVVAVGAIAAARGGGA